MKRLFEKSKENQKKERTERGQVNGVVTHQTKPGCKVIIGGLGL